MVDEWNEDLQRTRRRRFAPSGVTALEQRNVAVAELLIEGLEGFQVGLQTPARIATVKQDGSRNMNPTKPAARRRIQRSQSSIPVWVANRPPRSGATVERRIAESG